LDEVAFQMDSEQSTWRGTGRDPAFDWTFLGGCWVGLDGWVVSRRKVGLVQSEWSDGKFTKETGWLKKEKDSIMHP